MFVKFDDWQDGKPYSKWRWLQPTVTGLVITSIFEGKADITKYPPNNINMPRCYYEELAKFDKWEEINGS